VIANEIMTALIGWTAKRGGAMPNSARLDRQSWLSFYRERKQADSIVDTVLNGNTVIWFLGIPFREDNGLDYKTVEFDE